MATKWIKFHLYKPCRTPQIEILTFQFLVHYPIEWSHKIDYAFYPIGTKRKCENGNVLFVYLENQ